jgi:hypothetical protein
LTAVRAVLTKRPAAMAPSTTWKIQDSVLAGERNPEMRLVPIFETCPLLHEEKSELTIYSGKRVKEN